MPPVTVRTGVGYLALLIHPGASASQVITRGFRNRRARFAPVLISDLKLAERRANNLDGRR